MIFIEKAAVSDAEKLTAIMKKTFDEEARKWLSDSKSPDYNIQPPGYSSIEMTKYMIEELAYYKINEGQEIVGGIIVTITGKAFGRIDRIFIDPKHQGKQIGSRAMNWIENEFPTVKIWDLETSSKQVGNHHFYEKMGYKLSFKTKDEFGYIKKKENKAKNSDFSDGQYEDCDMEETEYYQANLARSSFSNSNLMDTHFTNCNLSHSKFKNVNFRNALYADLNFSYSKLRFVSLGGVRFIDTNLGEDDEPISFERCDLKGSKITNSNLTNVQLHDCNLTGMTIDDIPVEKLLEVYYQQMKKN